MILLLDKNEKKEDVLFLSPNFEIVQVNVDAETLDYLIDAYVRNEK